MLQVKSILNAGNFHDRKFTISHEPDDTPRYLRAWRNMRRIITKGQVIGANEISVNCIEIVTWTERTGRESYDLYTVFRCILNDNRELVRGELVCYYDGTEGSKISVKSEMEARAEMRQLFPEYREL